MQRLQDDFDLVLIILRSRKFERLSAKTPTLKWIINIARARIENPGLRAELSFKLVEQMKHLLAANVIHRIVVCPCGIGDITSLLDHSIPCGFGDGLHSCTNV